MDLYVLNNQIEVKGIISSYQSIIWNMQYFGPGDFELITSASENNLTLLAVGNFLVRDIDRLPGVYNNVMVIESKEISFDSESGWVLTVRGKGLKNILKRRIVWQQLNLTGTVEDSIRQVITENVINPEDTDRAILNFELAEKLNLTEEAEIQLLGENIAEWLENVCTQYGYGWDVYISNKKFVFKLYVGKNRTYDQTEVEPVLFSPDLDNLYNSVYSLSLENYGNAGLVGGEGEGINQKTAAVGSGSGLDRFEVYIDGGSVSSNGEIITLETYTQMLESYGNEQLAAIQKTQSFEGEIEPNGIYRLNVDYFLGDIVEVRNEKGVSATPRIIEIIYSEDANGVSVVPTFSEWEVI